jgi:hypothetical protein
VNDLIRLGLLGALLACGPKPKDPPTIQTDIATTLEMARTRPTPERATVRVTVKVKSETLGVAGSTGGGLVVDRPGRLFLEVFGPLGASLVKVASDGEGLSVLLPKDRRQLAAASAEVALREISGEAIGLDDLAGLLVGDLPFDAAELQATRVLEDGQHQADLLAPGGVHILADLDPAQGTPTHLLAADQDGVTMVEAWYGPFEPDESGLLWPTEVQVLLPDVPLEASLKYKAWKPVDQAPPVFSTETPDGFEVESLEEALRGLGSMAAPSSSGE